MKTSNRWLFIIVGVIATLVIAAVALVLFAQDDSPLLPENTPEGIVQRYLAALEARDYQAAYNYLSSDVRIKNPYSGWKAPIVTGSNTAWQATIGKASITNQNATVEVNIDRFYSGSSLNNSVYTQSYTFELVLESGAWKINRPDYIYFIY